MKELNFLDSNHFKISDFEHGQGIKEGKLISTPFMAKSGDMLGIYAYKKQDGVLKFSDFGNLYWDAFSSVGIKPDITLECNKIQNILNHFGCYRDQDVFFKEVDKPKLYATEYEFFRFVQCLINLMYLLYK